MASETLKVAVLARAGTARDRLREVVVIAGAQCVLEADPLELESAELAGCGAKVVLIALEPQTEDALERFDDVLADPELHVIFEEASLAASREGWDMARWQRHLVAKMQRHDDVLPPGAETEDAEVTATAATAAPVSIPDPELNPFDPVFAETAGDSSVSVSIFEPAEVIDTPELSLVDVADDVAASAVEAMEWDSNSVLNPDAAADLDVTTEELQPSAFGILSLHDSESDSPASPVETTQARERFARDISDLEARISGLTLVDDSPKKEPEGARGAVLVLAGLGGPDAVRQLVAALPAGFPRPVLIHQRLDGGRHDKLVAQMQRATELRVVLAEAGQYAQAGTIYILRDQLGVEVSEAGIRFEPERELLAVLPAGDSAVLLLSGSDTSLVDATLNHGWGGALVAGQAAEGCYDPAASNALASRGGDTGTPPELAQRLAERWPA